MKRHLAIPNYFYMPRTYRLRCEEETLDVHALCRKLCTVEFILT